jgi:hypothetical protein
MLAPFSGPWLVCTTKVYPGLGADIVMESITLIIGLEGEQTAQAKCKRFVGATAQSTTKVDHC